MIVKPKSIYSFEAPLLSGKNTALEQFRGQVLLVVNTASLCGFTPQYEGLQKLYEAYHAKGFSILAFPCNQFGHQEPSDSEGIKSVCDARFKITFPVFQKIEVNGSGAHPLYVWLKREAPGVLGTQAIKWNFTKFLINRQGEVVCRYGSLRTPETIRHDIELALAK